MSKKDNKIKELLIKAGKVTLPVMMLMGGAWKGDLSGLSVTELENLAKEKKLTKPAVELQINVNNVNDEDSQLLAYNGRYGKGCFGCSGYCAGACTGTCSSSCKGTNY